MSDMRVTILGCGTMGEAILKGLLACGDWQPHQIHVTTRREKRALKLAKTYGVEASTENAEAVSGADWVLLGVKPQMALEILAEPEVRQALRGALLVSICAGLKLSQMDELLPETSLIRAMPNTPCLIREGMTVLSAGPRSTPEQMRVTENMFASVGRTRVLQEKHMNAVTALSGSGPAFGFVMMEALADGGVMMGLPRDVAIELSAQTMQGAARLILETGMHPASLKDDVTTPAGCTIAGLLTMEDGRIRSILARAIQEATNVAAGLGKTDS